MANPEPEAILWHTNTDLPESGMERKQYHISIVDGDKRIEMIVTYQNWDKLLTVEPFVLHELDYTVHDDCDHEEDYCVLDDPKSGAYQDMLLDQAHYQKVKKLHPDAKQQPAVSLAALARRKAEEAMLVQRKED